MLTAILLRETLRVLVSTCGTSASTRITWKQGQKLAMKN